MVEIDDEISGRILRILIVCIIGAYDLSNGSYDTSFLI